MHSTKVGTQETSGIAWYLWGAFALLLIVDVTWAHAAEINFTGILRKPVLLLMLAIWLAYGVTRRSARLADMGQYGALWMIFGVLGCMFSYCAATLPMPLYDDTFVRMDAALGFNWLEWHRFIDARPYVSAVLHYAYISLPLQISFAFMYFSHRQDTFRNRELIWIALLSCVLTSLLAGFFPARGAYEYFGMVERAGHLSDLTALRTPGADSFPLGKLKGIITMPSYHTVMAVYFAYAFRRRGLLFYAFALLNAIMTLSVLSHGGHYLVDLLGGLVVAAVSIAAVRYASRFSLSIRTAGRLRTA